jgi:hypothetical protein
VTGRSRVSTRLYWAALSDAIAWQQSLMDAHDRNMFGSGGHCKPDERCGEYQVAERQLKRYRAAQAAIARGGSRTQ